MKKLKMSDLQDNQIVLINDTKHGYLKQVWCVVRISLNGEGFKVVGELNDHLNNNWKGSSVLFYNHSGLQI